MAAAATSLKLERPPGMDPALARFIEALAEKMVDMDYAANQEADAAAETPGSRQGT